MNIALQANLLDRAIDALRGHGLNVVVQKQPRLGREVVADAWLRVGKAKQHIDYVVEAKRGVAPAMLGAVITHLRHHAEAAKRLLLLLVTDYVTPPMAETLRTLEQQFVDAAGNAYLDGPGLLVDVAGRKAEGMQGEPRPGRAFTPAGASRPGGIPPPASLRTVREPLESHRSHQANAPTIPR